MSFEYLLFNLLVFSGPLIGSLLYKPSQWPQRRAALGAIGLLAGIFLIWDHFVTNVWWSFSPRYTLGPKIGNLPLEEILFFLTVPWSCLFIWHNLRQLSWGTWSWPVGLGVSLVGAVVAGWGLSQQLWYTGVIGLCLVLIGLIDHLYEKWLQRRVSSVFLGIVLCLTVVFNGYLTARPVVTYNPLYMTNLRLVTIPIEDLLYGLVLISGTIMRYERLVKKATG